MSFMRNYKVKQKIEKHFASNPDEVDKARSDLLWMNPTHINDYRKLTGDQCFSLEKVEKKLPLPAMRNSIYGFLRANPTTPCRELIATVRISPKCWSSLRGKWFPA